MALLLATVAVAAPPAAAGPPAPLPGAWRATVLAVGTAGARNQLFGVDARTPADVWAVGVDGDRTLAEHWNGSAWTRVPTPDAPSGRSTLAGVSAVSATDGWAVGSSFDTRFHPLAEHYDGVSWSSVPVAEPATGESFLGGVVALSASDAWAIGGTRMAVSPFLIASLLEHWDGRTWSIVPTPNPEPRGSTTLSDIAAVAPDDVWIVGQTGPHTLVLHWDGVQIRRVASPSVTTRSGLRSVATLAADDVWAAGATAAGGLIEHWDGTRWRVQATPPAIGDIAAISSDDVWTVSSRQIDVFSHFATVSQHWDGHTWSQVPPANPAGDDRLSAVDTAGGQLWAVGAASFTPLVERLVPEPLLDSGFADAALQSRVGLGTAWHVRGTDTSSHALRDATGLGLFDSGLRPPSGSFSFTYPAAGSYAVVDPASGARQTVAVAMLPSPKSGTVATRFLLRWARARAPAGRVYDVQVEHPGESAFAPWQTGVANASGRFLPDAGAGVYAFRARLRALSGASSDWSPLLRLAVAP